MKAKKLGVGISPLSRIHLHVYREELFFPVISYNHRVYKISPIESKSENPEGCPLTKRKKNLFVKSQIVNSLVFADHTIFVPTAHCNESRQ